MKLIDLKNEKHAVATAKLLQVVPIEISTLTKEFLNYDTDYGKYVLPFHGWYLMLIFKKPGGDLFTTLRPQFNRYGNKKDYYDALVGKDFDVIVEQTTPRTYNEPGEPDYNAPNDHERAEMMARYQRLK